MDNTILIKSSVGMTTTTVDARLLQTNRMICLEGEITHELVANVVKKILILRQEHAAKPIRLLLDSPGGSIRAGMTLYDLIQGLETPIEICCIGRAYSMAAILLACGKSGRYMLPNAEVMLHPPLLNTAVSGSCTSVQEAADRLKIEQKRLNALLAKHTGHTLRTIEKATAFENFMSAEEAVRFKLADKIVSFEEMMEE